MATPSKAQHLTEIQTLLKDRYPVEPGPEKLSVLESVVYGICHEDALRQPAVDALGRLKEGFFDWNEVRVSSLDEIKSSLKDLPDAEEKATRVRRFLRQLFEKTYAFNLDALAKKPQKEAVKTLEEYEATADDYVVATVTRLALAGHAIPIDSECIRGLRRLGVCEDDADVPTSRGALERAVPKNRGVEFSELIEALVHDTCVEGEPDCPRCVLQKICPTGQAQKAPKAGVKAAGRVKPGKAKSSD